MTQSTPFHRRLPGSLLAWSTLLLAAVSAPDPARADAFSEEQVKAAFLYNFASFVRWPDRAFSGPASPLHYCIFEGGQAGELLPGVLEDERVGGRPLELLPLDDVTRVRECHVVYVGSEGRWRWEGIQQALGEAPVLTVGDDIRTRGGAMIGLIRKQRQVHPVIDLDAIERRGLQVSAKLLRLATIVRHPEDEP